RSRCACRRRPVPLGSNWAETDPSYGRSSDLLVLDRLTPRTLEAMHLFHRLLLVPIHPNEARVVTAQHSRDVGFGHLGIITGHLIHQRELRKQGNGKLEPRVIGRPADPRPGAADLPGPLEKLVGLAPRHRAVEEADVHPDIPMPRPVPGIRPPRESRYAPPGAADRGRRAPRRRAAPASHTSGRCPRPAWSRDGSSPGC